MSKNFSPGASLGHNLTREDFHQFLHQANQVIKFTRVDVPHGTFSTNSSKQLLFGIIKILLYLCEIFLTLVQ